MNAMIHEIILAVILILSTVLYIYCQLVLFFILRRKVKEKLSSYLFIVFISGFVNLAAIFVQIFFQLLSTLMWQPFFYSLGSAGARFYYMILFGSEVFVILNEGFIAISRYLVFSRNRIANNRWSMSGVRKWLFGLLLVSVAYAAIFSFCPFETYLSKDETQVRFEFGTTTFDWVGVSIIVPFTLATFSLFSCIYCYYKVATIIKETSTGLTKSVVARMCLSSLIISFGAFLSLLMRITNHVSYLTVKHDALPFLVYFFIVRIGILIATCGNPWILLILFPTVRKEAFPCANKEVSQSTKVFTVTPPTQ